MPHDGEVGIPPKEEPKTFNADPWGYAGGPGTMGVQSGGAGEDDEAAAPAQKVQTDDQKFYNDLGWALIGVAVAVLTVGTVAGFYGNAPLS